MDRCIQLAQNGWLNTPPNPMVGAVIVCDGKIIGEGYHIQYGTPHAEVNAIRSVKDQNLLKRSTIYVSLEPCSHYGKTPPCADLIIEKGIPRVVIGCMDPFAKVAGKGIQKLKAAGIEVVVGIREKECMELNKRFITFHTHHRPYITLKWAESADGFIDRVRTNYDTEKPVVFSTPYTQMLTHRHRAIHQSILVGRQTALADNPSLQNRYWPGPSPLRLVIDRKGALPQYLHLFDGTAPTRVYIDQSTAIPTYARQEQVTCIPLDFNTDILPSLLNDLYSQSVQSLLVEGGSQLLHSFIASGLWDEIRIEQSDILLREGIPAPEKPHGKIQVYPADRNQIILIRHITA